jgi:mannose-1-phosphate guanylyltransferase
MSRTLRPLLLAAGPGTRLRPLTLHTPKCLVPIGGEPLLGRWLRQLDEAGCEAVLVNTHYLAEQVEAYLESWQSPTMDVRTVHEPELLGTARTLLLNQSFFSNYTGLLIHSDNAMAEGLRPFIDVHDNRQAVCLLTMLTFTTGTPSTCGIVELDDQHIVQGFYEKVMNPPGNKPNGALCFQAIPAVAPSPIDFSTEVIPSLMGRIQTWHNDQSYLDIGTPEALATAKQVLDQ